MSNETNKLSLVECRRAVANSEFTYKDEELIKMRDWLDNLADIALAIIKQNEIDSINEAIEKKRGKIKHNLFSRT